jgi:hypothetical protein
VRLKALVLLVTCKAQWEEQPWNNQIRLTVKGTLLTLWEEGEPCKEGSICMWHPTSAHRK